ncbi:MAG TPA: DUF3141 domain-containing protein, partial [Xanthobacteraceae bacterium]|nr:DUF3141 domain-containing protein [Xanthobacteraceae bacterium]
MESIQDLQQRTDAGILAGTAAVQQLQRLAMSAHQHGLEIASRQCAWVQAASAAVMQLQGDFMRLGWTGAMERGGQYLIDAWQRGVLTADVLRRRANVLDAHDAAGAPPVLCFDYDVIVDGRTLKRPVNYSLLSIRPPAGVEVH